VDESNRVRDPSFCSKRPLQRPWPTLELVRPARGRTRPLVLSRQEVQSILAEVRWPLHRTVLTTIYSCGLRLNEATGLRVEQVTVEPALSVATQVTMIVPTGKSDLDGGLQTIVTAPMPDGCSVGIGDRCGTLSAIVRDSHLWRADKAEFGAWADSHSRDVFEILMSPILNTRRILPCRLGGRTPALAKRICSRNEKTGAKPLG